MRRSLLLSSTACLLASCAAPLARELPPPAAIVLAESPELAEIAQLEDARSDGGGRLEAFLQSPDRAVRERAAAAAGRLSSHAAGPSLDTALGRVAALDAAVSVRCAALFALGQRGDARSAEQVAALVDDESPRVRARAVEALAKLPRPDLRGAVLGALADADPRVRLEAAHGPHRWSREEAGAEAVDQRLAAALASETETEVVVYALATLERRKAAAGREAFLRYCTSPISEVRLFAVRGLKALAPEAELLDELIRATGDGDWRVVCEALQGLASYDAASATRSIAEATRHASPHVRRTAWESLAARSDRADERDEVRDLLGLLEPFLLDERRYYAEPSLSVRAAYQELELPLGVRWRTLDTGWTEALGREKVALLDQVVVSQPAVVLAGVARALGRVEQEFAREMLATLASQRDPFVAGAALEALGRHPGRWTREVLRPFLLHRDNGLRLAALLALSGMAQPEDLPAIEESFRTTRGEIGAELRYNAVRVAQRLAPSAPTDITSQALSDPDPYVRHVAREAYRALGLEPPAPTSPPAAIDARVPLAGVDYPLYERNPLVEVVTSRGSLVFELFPAEAPVHVHSFLELARRRVYNGLTFHRVVPDFVVQGGDPRGDGNGGASWRGDALRAEIGPRKYVRGSLGMPRNEDPDSGGGQLFVTHRPTPHLDGRYTIFGELRAGGDVLDALEVGDRILAVEPR